MAVHTWVSIVLTALIVTGVASFAAGYLTHGNHARGYRAAKEAALALVSTDEHRERELDTVRARWESERVAVPVVNVYLAAPSWPQPLPAPQAASMRVLGAQVVPGLPAGWS